MKLLAKLAAVFLLAALVLTPLGVVHAQGLADGPFFGENFTLESGETFSGDLVVFGGSVTLEKDSTVTGSVVLIGGSLVADGEVRSDMVVIGGAVSLGSDTHIYGNLVTVGAPVNRAEGARVDGDIINNPKKPTVTVPEIPVVPVTPRPNTVVDGVVSLFWSVFNLFAQSVGLGLLAALLVLFLPQQTRRVGEAIPRQPAWTGAMGLASVVLFVVAIVALALFSVLIITLILTIPMILVLSVVFAAAMVFGWIGLGTEIGLRLGTALKIDFPLPLAAGVGAFLLSLVANGFGLIPCIGWIVPTLVGLVSLGAVFLTRFGTKPLTIMAAQAPVESAPPADSV